MKWTSGVTQLSKGPLIVIFMLYFFHCITDVIYLVFQDTTILTYLDEVFLHN